MSTLVPPIWARRQRGMVTKATKVTTEKGKLRKKRNSHSRKIYRKKLS